MTDLLTYWMACRVIKRKFRILNSSPEYSIDVQSDLVLSLTALYNFTRNYNGSQVDDYIKSTEGSGTEGSGTDEDKISDILDLQASLTSNKEIDIFRDLMAEQMWNDYQEYRTRIINHDFHGLYLGL